MNVLHRLRDIIASHALPAALVAVVATAGIAGAGGYAIGHHSSSDPTASSSSNPSDATIPTAPSSTSAKAGKKGTATEGLGAAKLIALVASTTGISSQTITADLQSGQTLNQISGANAGAVVSAANAAVTKLVDAAVSAGKATQAQASAMQTKAQTKITQLMALPGSQLLAMIHKKTPAAKATPMPSPTSSQ